MNQIEISILIPCRDEEEIIVKTLKKLTDSLKGIEYEIIIINDFSKDNTKKNVISIAKLNKRIFIYDNEIKGLGGAINLGLEKSNGKFISIFMADMSDSPLDLLEYIKLMKIGNIDAVFGSRFIKKSKIYNYPLKKLILNRIFNFIARVLFDYQFNDYTNAFKIYKKDVLIKLRPLVSENFNIFLEIPIKIVSRGYSYKIIPISWKNRKIGEAKFRINELGSKYIFTLLYVFLEKILLRKKKF